MALDVLLDRHPACVSVSVPSVHRSERVCTAILLTGVLGRCASARHVCPHYPTGPGTAPDSGVVITRRNDSNGSYGPLACSWHGRLACGSPSRPIAGREDTDARSC